MYRSIVFSVILMFSMSSISAEYEAEVLKVIDGDTIYIKSDSGRKKIRLRHIDAPELKQTFGEEAKIFLDNQLDGRKLSLIHI